MTLASAGDLKMDGKTKKIDSALKVCLELAKANKLKKIEVVALIAGGYKYQGRVKALADGAREGGLKN